MWLLLAACLSHGCSREPIQRTTAPDGALEVVITARLGTWTATYPGLDKTCDDRLISVVGQPIAVRVESPHGSRRLCVPSLKLDENLSMGGELAFWTTPDVSCRLAVGEGCGEDKSTMKGTWVVVSPSDFEAWKRSGDCAPLDPEAPDYGEKLFSRLACSSCHSVDGSRGSGPHLDGLFGRREVLVCGTEITVDEAYVRESILKPHARVVRGFAPNMPELGDTLKEGQLDALVTYLRSLSPQEVQSDAP